jgi:hypothetical protein
MDLQSSIRKLARRGIGACALVALSAGLAAAAPALVTRDTNQRQGPGTNFAVLGTIPGGSTVEVAGCDGEWCTVFWRGRRGFAVARNLDLGGPGPGPGPGPAVVGPVPPPAVYYDPPPPVVVVGPPYYYGPRYYWGPRYYYGGPRWRRW